MFSGTQRRFSAILTRRARRLAGLLVLGLFVPAILQAQDRLAIIGHIEGDDLSVQDSAASASPQNPGSILLTSGSIITVRSGQARVELTAGGQIGVCGAAKFTLLASNAAVTLAVSYGRVRVHLDGSTPLVLYTPTVVATPVAIADGSRDVTLGLETTGSLCVLASHGAVRLQQQFTGETLTVPQPTEMFLAGQQLKALPGGSAHCECDALNARAAPRPSPSIPATAPAVVPAAPAAVAKSAAPETRASVELSIAAPAAPHAAQTPKTPPASVPEHEETAWKVVMPTLAFDANAAAAPPDPSPAIILLVREVRIAPDWVFHGTVASPAPRSSARSVAMPVARPAARAAAPPPAAAVVTAPVAPRVTPAVAAPTAKVVAPPPAAPAQRPVVASAPAPKKKNDSKPGFFRRLFGARRPPCEGAGC
ncbi:MAG TPA: hypothetical protein VG033_10590 [Candidatus Acidoferrales bacterium]|jgi:hypothetical protein|nr:hypothetical protein [Candidatus Acidoferrales bacterium]